MDDQRAATLLPRLLQVLNTIDNDTEIVAIVRRIRAIAGKEAFTPDEADDLRTARPSDDLRTGRLSDDVSLGHPDPQTSVRLRGLGVALRLIEPAEPMLDAVMQRVRMALIEGGTVRRLDLLTMLAHLRDPVPLNREVRETADEGSGSLLQQQLHNVMAALRGRTWT